MWQNYNPKKVILSIGGQPLSGYADGTMITVVRNEPMTEHHVGTDGFGIFTDVVDDSGGVLVRLANYSPSNAILYAYAIARAPAPALMTDSRSLDKFFSSAVMVGNLPDLSRDRGPTMNEWQLIFIQGNIMPLGAKPITP